MITPKRTDVGRLVVCRAYPGATPEQGVITSINERGVFVRFGLGTQPIAQPVEKLEWAYATPPDKAAEAVLIDDILGAE